MIIRIQSDSGDPQYDMFVEADDDKFSPTDALDAVANAIKQVKAEFPDDCQFGDLVDAFPEGITPANILTAREEW